VGDTDLQIFTYTAQDYDPETGLLHFYARYYDPATGTWLTQDSYRGELLDPVSLHRYAYVGGNPTTWVDVYGYWGLPSFDIPSPGDVVNAVKDTASKVGEAVGEKFDEAANWVEENQDTIVKGALTVGAIAGTAALCVAAPGIGCAVGGALIAGATSYGEQVVDNAWDENSKGFHFTKESFTENIDLRQIAIASGTGLISAGAGGVATKIAGKVCKGSTCAQIVNGGMDQIGGGLEKLYANTIDGDPCTNLFDGYSLNPMSLFGGSGGKHNRQMNATSGMVSVKSSNTQTTLHGLAQQADKTTPIPPGTSARVGGTKKHTTFRNLVKGLGRDDLTPEVTYLNNERLPNNANAKGSVRLDVVEGPLDAPTAVYDLKTGAAGLSPARIRQIREHLPNSGRLPNGQLIPIIEVRR
jgi:RHS repeat-associated protein